MKINWGYSILIVIILFLTGMGTLVYITFQHKINLVNKDYYPLEIDYQQMINRKSNTLNLTNKPSFKYNEEKFIISFPDDFVFADVEGEVQFYRPSDFEDDEIIALELSSDGEQIYETSELLKGSYIVKINWQYHSKDYYQEFELYIK